MKEIKCEQCQNNLTKNEDDNPCMVKLQGVHHSGNTKYFCELECLKKWLENR